MVIVMKGSEQSEKSAYFDELYRLRYEVFIKGRGWSLPSLNGYEIDQYDDADAVYFIDLNESGFIQAGIRVTPTVKSSLMADYFPHLVEEGASPRGQGIHECTRYIVLPRRQTGEPSRVVKARIIGAMLEWGLEEGLSYLQTVIEAPTLSAYVEMTPQTMPLGLAHPYGGGRGAPGGGECMAIRWPVTREVVDDIRAYGALEEPRPDRGDTEIQEHELRL